MSRQGNIRVAEGTESMESSVTKTEDDPQRFVADGTNAVAGMNMEEDQS